MELILNLLTLKEKQRAAFIRAAEGYAQVFAPNGVLEDGSAVPSELYRRSCVILGNPSVKELTVCENLRFLQTKSAGTEQYQKPGAPPADHPLWTQERAVMTPHTAGGNHLADTTDRIAAIALEHLSTFIKDREAKTPVRTAGLIGTP